MDLRNRLYKFADDLEKEGQIRESQEIDNLAMILMEKHAGSNTYNNIINFFKKLTRKPSSTFYKKEPTIQEILDKQWGIKERPLPPKDYTGEILK